MGEKELQDVSYLAQVRKLSHILQFFVNAQVTIPLPFQPQSDILSFTRR